MIWNREDKVYERVKKLQNENKQANKSSVQTARKKSMSTNTSSRIIETPELRWNRDAA